MTSPAHFSFPFALVMLDVLFILFYGAHVIHALYLFIWDHPAFCAFPALLAFENGAHGFINGFTLVSVTLLAVTTIHWLHSIPVCTLIRGLREVSVVQVSCPTIASEIESLAGSTVPHY